MNGSNGMNGSMSTNGATAKGDAMGTVPAATPKFTDSPEQAAVIQAPSYEDVVVVAGAGSGKTYTMTRRIITLIDQGISPEKILGLTFTRKAASELLSRVSAAVTRNQAGRGTRVAFLKPEVSTYDAFFQSIVRQYGLLVGFDQNTHITPKDVSEDIRNYGEVLMAALDAAGSNNMRLRRVAEKCMNPDPAKRYQDVNALRLALADRKTNNIYLVIIAFLVAMIALLLWLNSPYRPEPLHAKGATESEAAVTSPLTNP